MSKQTPMMSQYCRIKAEYSDCILCFRLGDFYELFEKDAEDASRVLGITLTQRHQIPMAGFPHHAATLYIPKLLHAGYKIAVCEQLETPSANQKGPLERNVVRILTPGTVLEDHYLETQSNFLLAVTPVVNNFVSCAVCDFSTGDIFTEHLPEELLANVLEKWKPTECLCADSTLTRHWEILKTYHSQGIPDVRYNAENSKRILQDNYGLANLVPLGPLTDLEISATAVCLSYIEYTQRNRKISCKFPTQIHQHKFVHVDNFTMKNLEIEENASGTRDGTLLSLMQNGQTPSGNRMIGLWIKTPIKDLEQINHRLDAVEFFTQHPAVLKTVQTILSHTPDIDRACSRIDNNQYSLKDFANLQQTITKSTAVLAALTQQPQLPVLLDKTLHTLDLSGISKLITETIKFEALSDEYGVVQTTHNNQIRLLTQTLEETQQQISNLQESYQNSCNIPQLKIKTHNILGHVIEVSRSQAHKMPFQFEKLQDLQQASRYTTSALKQLSNKQKTLISQITELEKELIAELASRIQNSTSQIRKMIGSIALIDATAAFASTALTNNYTRPTMNNTNSVDIVDGRHPVVEQESEFVPNNCILTSQKCILMTGPNMSGKSTYLRQNAIIVYMAHVGSFVPATKATVGITDGIFVRLGSADNVRKGMSTFMLEMSEISRILNLSTKQSFIVVDEIGRGTSSKEGEAVAESILEYLSIKGMRVLFATHYYVLTQTQHDVQLLTMQVKKHEDTVIFMHKLTEGTASNAYALQVCKLAGIPQNIIVRANKILANN